MPKGTGHTKNAGDVSLLDLTPRALRTQLEDTIGARLRGWIMRAECSFTDVARALGMHREELYELMEGKRPFKFAWFDLLPPKARKVALDELAGADGYELRHMEREAEPDSMVSASNVIREACDVIRTATDNERDGATDRREAERELAEINELEEAMSKRRAHLRRVIEEGAVVRPMRGGRA